LLPKAGNHFTKKQKLPFGKVGYGLGNYRTFRALLSKGDWIGRKLVRRCVGIS
jgi:hypothetical protein